MKMQFIDKGFSIEGDDRDISQKDFCNYMISRKGEYTLDASVHNHGDMIWKYLKRQSAGG